MINSRIVADDRVTNELEQALSCIGLNVNNLTGYSLTQPDLMQNLVPLEKIKYNMKYLEQEKYPSDLYKVLTGSVIINNQPMQLFHVSYEANEDHALTDFQIDRINQASVKLRMSSILAGTMDMLEKSTNFLTNDSEQREKLRKKLEELANVLLNPSDLPRHQSKQAIVDDYIHTIASEISTICNIDINDAIRSIRNAEKYFIAEYNQKRVLIFKTDRESTQEPSTIQIDVPFGNQISDEQKSEYLKIHTNDPPEWFNVLPAWEKDWLTARVPKSASDDWSEFNSIFQSSAMQHLPGIKNARYNYLLYEQPDQTYDLLSKSFKTATIVPYEMPLDQQHEHARLNSYQLLDQLHTQAKNQFDELWGSTNLPNHIKPLVLVNSLLSDTKFSEADSNLSKFQDDAIKSYAKKNAGNIYIVSGNEPVNLFRAIAVQGKSRWKYANQVINYAKTLDSHLSSGNIKLNDDQKKRLELSRQVVSQLESLSKLNQASLFKYNVVKHRNFEAFKTAYVSILAESVGGAVSTNCKSGKDRTGLDELYRHAILIYYQRYNRLPSYTDEGIERNNFNKIYIDLFNAMKAQEAAASNTPGSFGIKDSALMLCRDMVKNLGKSYTSSNSRANMNKPERFLKDEAKQARSLVLANEAKKIVKNDRIRGRLSNKEAEKVYAELEALAQSYKQQAEQIFYSLDRSPLKELSIKVEKLKKSVELINQEHSDTRLSRILKTLDIITNNYVNNQLQLTDQVITLGKSAIIVPIADIDKHLDMVDARHSNQPTSGFTQHTTTPKTVPLINENTAKINTLELWPEKSRPNIFGKKAAKASSVQVQSVQKIHDNKSSLESYFNNNNIGLLSKESYLVWAVTEVENFKALCTNRNDPMEMYGQYPKNFVKFALLYCAYQEIHGRGDEYKIINNTKYRFKFNDNDIKFFENLLDKNQHHISGYHAHKLLTLNREKKIESRIVPPHQVK